MTEPTPTSAPDYATSAGGAEPPPRVDDLRAALVLQREADAMIAEALQTRRAALKRAEHLVREVEQAAARAEEDAAAASAKRIAEAHEEADRLLAEAQHQAGQITSDARTEVAALRRDAADLRDCAQETLEAAELEWEQARRTMAHQERRLAATRTEAFRMIEGLERVDATLDAMLERVRSEVASARRALAQLDGDVPSVDEAEPGPSVVLQWPRPPAPTPAPPPASPDASAADQASKHRRADSGGRSGRLRRARP